MHWINASVGILILLQFRIHSTAFC